MMAYTTAISQINVAPPAMTPLQLEYPEVVVHALLVAKRRFFELHRLDNFQDMSAWVSIDKFLFGHAGRVHQPYGRL